MLSNPTGGATIARGTATVTILDNDNRLVATTAAPAGARPAPAITAAGVRRALRTATALWIAAGAPAALLAAVTIRIADLPDAQLAYADGSTIVLDADAAGWGWHTNPFARVRADRIDLLTVLLHELGHVLGYDHADRGVMHESLAPGARLAPLGQSPPRPRKTNHHSANRTP